MEQKEMKKDLEKIRDEVKETLNDVQAFDMVDADKVKRLLDEIVQEGSYLLTDLSIGIEKVMVPVKEDSPFFISNDVTKENFNAWKKKLFHIRKSMKPVRGNYK